MAYFLRDTGIKFVFFVLGYGIFGNFGIWDIGIHFGIRVKLILGYGIFWTVYFGIWDIAYPLIKPHVFVNPIVNNISVIPGLLPRGLNQ